MLQFDVEHHATDLHFLSYLRT